MRSVRFTVTLPDHWASMRPLPWYLALTRDLSFKRWQFAARCPERFASVYTPSLDGEMLPTFPTRKAALAWLHAQGFQAMYLQHHPFKGRTRWLWRDEKSAANVWPV